MFNWSKKTKRFFNRYRIFIALTAITAIFAASFVILFMILQTRVEINTPPSVKSHQGLCREGCEQEALRPSDVLTDAKKVRDKIDLDFKKSVDFQRSLVRVLKHEGGYVSDPDDPGGETKFGVSKRSYPNLDIKNLTLNDISAIYYRDFWHKASLEDVAKEELQHKLLDMVVQFGVEGGLRIWRKALKEELEDTGQNIDLNDASIEKLIELTNKADPLHMMIELRIAMMSHYLSVTKKNPKMRKYLHGWLTRAHDDDGKLLSVQSQKS